MDDPREWFAEAAKVARAALCLQARCGAVIVRDGDVLSHGFNGPPRNDLSLRSCGTLQPSALKPKSDRTCCVHAECRALLDLPKTDLAGSTMVFCRVDDRGEMKTSGDPYCTMCSRLALETGIDSWMLWHDSGIRLYSAREYHQLSERYDRLQEVRSGAGGAGGGRV